MKKYLSVPLGLLLLPFFAFAAFDDVTLTTDTDIEIGDSIVSVSGSSAEIESIEVDTNTFTVTLQAGSTITISSDDKKVIGYNPSQAVTISRTCTDTASTLSISGVANKTTVVIDLGATCSSSTTSSSGSGGGGAPGTVSTGGGGGGGGGSSSPPPAPPPAPPTLPTPEQAQPSPVALLVSPVFNRTLEPGMTHVDVKRLQQLLNSDPDTRIADSGVGSSGNETDFYGALTTAAVQKFQAKHGVVSSGTPDTTGYGLVGPATRQALILAFASGVSAPSPAPAPSPVPSPTPAPAGVSAAFTAPLGNGDSNADVKRLQQLLNSDPDTRIAASGVGSPGNETDFFGSLTEQAVQKFQVKYGVAGVGDPGYGFVGPRTRATLNALFSEGSSAGPGASETTPAPSPSPASPVSAEAQLQAQLDDLNAQVLKLIEQLEAAQ